VGEVALDKWFFLLNVFCNMLHANKDIKYM
jgi:hypothetical protein